MHVKKLLGGHFRNLWSTGLVSLATICSSLITNKLASLHLSPETFAIYGQSMLVATLLASILCAGLNNSIIKLGDNYLDIAVLYTAWGIILLLGLGFLAWFFSFDLWKILLIAPPPPWVYVLSIFIITGYVITNLMLTLPVLYENRIEYIKISLSQILISAIVVILSFYMKLPWLIAFVIIVRPALLGLIIGTRTFNHTLKRLFSLKLIHLFQSKSLIKTVSGYYIYGVVALLSNNLGVLLVRQKISEQLSLTEVGNFFAAQRFFELILSLVSVFYSTFYFRSCSNSPSRNKILISTSFASALLFCLIQIVCIKWDAIIVSLLFSVKQHTAINYFAAFSTNMVVMSLVFCTGFYLLSISNKMPLLIAEILSFVFLTIIVSFDVFTGYDLAWTITSVSAFKLFLNLALIVNRRLKPNSYEQIPNCL